ncbi:MAG: Hsp20/alpha crystallin family protein [Anaerolineae bacterium]|nr:Hsp20/alpha crystallin family protein [Anaerolineae bacterium]
MGSGGLAVDMYETDESVVVESALQGARSEDIEISLLGDVLTISAKASPEENVSEESYICRERRCISLRRSVSVPVLVVAEEAEAVFENGVLTLTLPKAEEAKLKSIGAVVKGQ